MTLTTEPENKNTSQVPAPTNFSKKPPASGSNLAWILIVLCFIVILAVLSILTGLESTRDSPISEKTPLANTTENTFTDSSLVITDFQRINDLVSDPKDPDSMFLATDNGIRQTGDGGKTWQDAAEGLNGARITSLALDGSDLQRPIYAASDRKGLFKSVDGGKSWQSTGLENRNIVKVIASNSKVYVAVNGPLNGVYRSLDGGKTWVAPSPNSLPSDAVIKNLSIDLSNDKELYLSSSYVENSLSNDWSRIKISRDGAVTWSQFGSWTQETILPDPKGSYPVLLAAAGERVYAGNGESLFRLTPERNAWILAGGGLPDKGVYGVTIDPQRSGIVYAATLSGLFRNSDGLHWVKMSEGTKVSLQSFSQINSAASLKINPLLLTVNAQNKARDSSLSSTMLYALTADGFLISYENKDFGDGTYASITSEGVVVPDFSPYGGVNPAARMDPPDPTVIDTNRSYFNETGHYLVGGFKNFWERNSGLAQFGFPISEEFGEFDDQKNIRRTVQYFERGKLEYLANQLPGKEIQIALIGKEALAGRYIVPARFTATTSQIRYFDVTQHTLKGIFKQFWEGNGGLVTYGYPISEEMEEPGSDGKMILVQYFERSKFQLINGKVQLALIGVEVLQKKGWLPK